MKKTASNFNFSVIENILFGLDVDHTSTKLNKLKDELNKFFPKAKCKEIIYTVNNDKLFFGMRVYPEIKRTDVYDILKDDKTFDFDTYYVEFDSKLFDPMLNLEKEELTAILLHEIGHIVYDTNGIDEVRKHIDMYFVNSGEDLPLDCDSSYKEILAYALKDAVVKQASLFSKFGNDELIADTFVVSTGYGEALESGFRKILRSSTCLNKDVDDRFIVLSWALRLHKSIKINRLPAIRTLNKAKTLTGSQLEKREIAFAVTNLNKASISEGTIDNVRARFNKKITDFKAKGIRLIKNDIYELNLRLRVAENEMDLLYIIRTVNNDVAILQDYLTEPELSEEERNSVLDTLEELYALRTKAAKEKNIRDKYSSLIQVVYPDLS